MKRAFSLLEMMVAIAILSMGLLVLFQVQVRSIRLAQKARDMTVATMLARSKLLDCENDLLKKGFSVGDYEQDGNFGDDGYDKFFWECHGYKPDMPNIDSAAGGDASALPGAAGAAAGAAQDQGTDMGMQFLAPILSQMSGIMGDSIRELVVIVRWGQGDDVEEMTVTTHVVDKGPVNQVAGMISAQAGALKSLTGGGAGGDSGGSGSGGSGSSGSPGKNPPKTAPSPRTTQPTPGPVHN